MSAPDPRIEGAIARLQLHKMATGFLPSQFSEELAQLLYGSARLGRWSHVAKALYDQGSAIALYVSLFPNDRWMLGHAIYGVTKPTFEFAAFPPYVDGDEKGETLIFPNPLCEVTHDVCGIAIVIAALRRRAQEPLATTASRAVEVEAKN
jgi:hypothetical protein